MKTVRFEYRERGSVKYVTSQIPERLSEATGQQFTALLALAQGRIAEEPFFLTFFGIPEKVLHRLDLWQLYVLTDQLRDIWQLEQIDHFPIEQIIIPWEKDKRNKPLFLMAPAPQLKGMTFQQFMTVDQFYQWYIYTGKQQYLMAMVAALYIEKDKEFQQTDIGHVAQRLENSPHRWLCEGLAFNWSMIRAWLSTAYPHLFPASPSDTATDSATPRSFGGGIIEKVVSGGTGGAVTLKLEDGELGAVAVDDLCMGIWHDTAGNATADTDDRHGNFTFAGFKTVYFRITAVPATDLLGEDNSDHHYFEYALRSMAEGGNRVHPHYIRRSLFHSL